MAILHLLSAYNASDEKTGAESAANSRWVESAIGIKITRPKNNNKGNPHENLTSLAGPSLCL